MFGRSSHDAKKFHRAFGGARDKDSDPPPSNQPLYVNSATTSVVELFTPQRKDLYNPTSRSSPEQSDRLAFEPPPTASVGSAFNPTSSSSSSAATVHRSNSGKSYTSYSSTWSNAPNGNGPPPANQQTPRNGYPTESNFQYNPMSIHSSRTNSPTTSSFDIHPSVTSAPVHRPSSSSRVPERPASSYFSGPSSQPHSRSLQTRSLSPRPGSIASISSVASAASYASSNQDAYDSDKTNQLKHRDSIDGSFSMFEYGQESQSPKSARLSIGGPDRLRSSQSIRSLGEHNGSAAAKAAYYGLNTTSDPSLPRGWSGPREGLSGGQMVGGMSRSKRLAERASRRKRRWDTGDGVAMGIDEELEMKDKEEDKL